MEDLEPLFQNYVGTTGSAVSSSIQYERYEKVQLEIIKVYLTFPYIIWS